MSGTDESLLGEIARRNWLILFALVLASLAWKSAAVVMGVCCGGLVVIAGYHWLQRSLRNLLAEPHQASTRSFQFGYFVRLAALAAVLLLLIAVVKVHPVALAVGLSTVVINLLWTTLRRAHPTRRQ